MQLSLLLSRWTLDNNERGYTTNCALESEYLSLENPFFLFCLHPESRVIELIFCRKPEKFKHFTLQKLPIAIGKENRTPSVIPHCEFIVIGVSQRESTIEASTISISGWGI